MASRTMNKRWTHRLARAFVVLGGLALGCESAAGELPPGKQAVFLARVIAYDGNLKARAGAAINVGIVSKKGDSGSETMADAMAKAFTQLGATTILGLPVKVSRIYFSGREALDRAVKDEGIDTFYVCSGLDSNLADIKSVARSRKVMTVASNESHLRLGISLGVFIVDGKNTIYVNLEASREEGISFGPDFLRLATVLK
jgi:hypothetical protein